MGRQPKDKINFRNFKITVEITDDNDCKTCPENGKVLNTDPDKDGIF